MTGAGQFVTWGRQACLPYESLWSLFQRFCWNNRICVSDFGALLVDFSQFEQKAGDLREPLWIDREAVCELLSLKPADFERAIHTHYTCPTEDGAFELLVSKSVRFCPDCFASGFHSPLHDLRFFAECPIHFKPLLTSCPKCAACLPFSLPRVQGMAFTCDCGHCFLSRSPSALGRRSSSALRSAERWAIAVMPKAVTKAGMLLRSARGRPQAIPLLNSDFAELSPSRAWYSDET